MTHAVTRRNTLSCLALATLVPSFVEAEPIADANLPTSPWAKIGGPEFASLLALALAGAPSIEDAKLRQRTAALAANEQRASLFPQVRAELNASQDRPWNRDDPERTSRSTNSATANVSWAIDLWGKARDELRAARLEAAAQAIEVEGARIVLALQISQAVVDRARAGIGLELARTELDRQRQIAEFVGARHLAGLTSAAEVAEAEAAVKSSEVALSEAGRNDRQATSSLAATLAIDPLTIRPEPISIRQDGDLGFLSHEVTYMSLTGRPDLRAIEVRLAAAGVRVRLAQRALYPDLSISHGITGSSGQFEALLAPRNLATQLAGTLTMAVLDGGRRKAQRQTVALELERLATAQRGLLLNAADEVLRAWLSLETINTQIPQRVAALEARRTTVTIARAQHSAGTLSTLELLRAEASLQKEEAEVLALPFDRFLASASMLAAMGAAP